MKYVKKGCIVISTTKSMRTFNSFKCKGTSPAICVLAQQLWIAASKESMTVGVNRGRKSMTVGVAFVSTWSSSPGSLHSSASFLSR